MLKLPFVTLQFAVVVGDRHGDGTLAIGAVHERLKVSRKD
jgi:hypothetical protein